MPIADPSSPRPVSAYLLISTPKTHQSTPNYKSSETISVPIAQKMKDDDPLPISSPTFTPNKKDSPDSTISGKLRYKFWALSVIILLAFWSMLTGTVTLRFSAGDLNRLSDDITGGSPFHDDLDVLELEDREKVVEQMWDVYINSRRIRLPRFWQEAFVAAYEDLISDAPAVREAAILEIAKMSVDSVDVHPPPSRSMNLRELSSHGRRRS